MNHVTDTLTSADISIFSSEISKFYYIKKYRYWLSFNFSLVSKDCPNKYGHNFDDVIKMATPGFLKIKFFWNKDYDLIIPIHDVIKKILSRNSNYIVDVVMWSKFGHSSISMRELIITSIL